MLKTKPGQLSMLGGLVPARPGGIWAGRFPEIRRLITLVRTALSCGRRPWLGIAMGAAAVVIPVLLRNPAIGPAVWHSGAVYASLPFATEVLRLPMSLFLPTPYLPLWGAVAQLVVVLGIAEMLFGRLVTVAVAALGHVAATLTARVIIDSIHGSLFGLTPALGHMLDTGPSAVATAVGAYLLLVVGMKRSAVLLCVALLVAAFALPGIDGVEHMIALAFGLLAGRLVSRNVLKRHIGEGSLRSSLQSPSPARRVAAYPAGALGMATRGPGPSMTTRSVPTKRATRAFAGDSWRLSKPASEVASGPC